MPSANSTPLSIDDLQAYLIRFTVTDYGIFVTMLICCILIGLYFGLEDHKKRKKTINRNSESQANEYLMGGRNMPIVPISLSLIASLVSGNLILGTLFNSKAIKKLSSNCPNIPRYCNGNVYLRHAILLRNYRICIMRSCNALYHYSCLS